LTVTVCAEFATPPELSVITMLPPRGPDAFGVKLSDTEQLEFTATDWPEQPSELIANSVSLEATLFTLSAALPVFVTVNNCPLVDVEFTGCDPKLMLAGKTVACGMGFVPVPVSVITTALPLTGVTVTVAVRAPVELAPGEKVSVMVQFVRA
jgi:hypothetical protein